MKNDAVVITGKEMAKLIEENRYYLGAGDIAIIHNIHLPKVIKIIGDYSVVVYNAKQTVFCKFDEIKQEGEANE